MTSATLKYNKIFISYAKEDFKYAENLYSFLAENGFQPWMDKKDLLPGQNWDSYIQNALRKANFILLLLSSTSVNKRGYVQKEFNQAVVYCDEKLDSDIFIIPVKIDDCLVPPKLSKFQWLEYSAHDSCNQILKAIEFQRKVVLKEEQDRLNKLEGFEKDEVKLEGEYGNKSPKFIFEILYPKFIESENQILDELNTLFKGNALHQLLSVRNDFFETLNDIDPEEYSFFSDSNLFSEITIHKLNQNFISYSSFVSVFNTGAAHGNYETIGFNYLLNPLRPLSLENVFEDYSDAINKLYKVVYQKLIEKAKEDSYTISGIAASREYFSNYYFKSQSIVFTYNPYEVAAFAFGDHHVEVTFEELKQLFPNENKLLKLINLMKG